MTGVSTILVALIALLPRRVDLRPWETSDGRGVSR